jgi:hypothetical protein
MDWEGSGGHLRVRYHTVIRVQSYEKIKIFCEYGQCPRSHLKFQPLGYKVSTMQRSHNTCLHVHIAPTLSWVKAQSLTQIPCQWHFLECFRIVSKVVDARLAILFRIRVRLSTLKTTIMTERLLGFPQALHDSDGIVPSNTTVSKFIIYIHPPPPLPFDAGLSSSKTQLLN